MDLILIIQIIIGFAALYGLIVSSYNLSINIKKTRYRVRVTLKRGYVATQSGAEGNVNSKENLLLKAQNAGYRTVTLNSMGYRIPKIKKDLVILNPQSNVKFPFELKEGKDCTVWSEENYIRGKLKDAGLSGYVKLVGIYADATGKEYRSKALKFEIGKTEG